MFGSVSASLLLSDLEEFSDQEHQVKPAKVAQWDQKSELRNELIVKVARLSLSKFETSQSSDSDDRFDLLLINKSKKIFYIEILNRNQFS